MKDGWHHHHRSRHRIRMWNTGSTASSIITAHPLPPLPHPHRRTQVGGASTAQTPPQTLPQLLPFWLTSWLIHNSVSISTSSTAPYWFYKPSIICGLEATNLHPIYPLNPCTPCTIHSTILYAPILHNTPTTMHTFYTTPQILPPRQSTLSLHP